ncbi:unnamed protein product [Laminaria digitata]
MVAGGYLLLLAGAVGAWAASSIRPDAFRIHFGALLPAGALYFSLTIVQLARVGPSNRHVEDAWATLHAGGDDLYITQAKVRTSLIVGGVLSAATFALVVAAAVASWAARRALLRLPGGGAGAGGWQGRPRLSRGEVLAATWALALAATSTFFDGSFAVFSAWLARDREQAVWLVAFWRAMGRGDRRYVEGDTFVVATAIIVAAVIGPGALLYAWSVYCRKGFRFSVGILVCAASLHTQLLRYVTSAGSSENNSGNSESGSGSGSESGGSGSGDKAFFIAASVILALLQVAGALAVLMYNIRRMTKRVHAAEVQYRALLLEHDRLSLKSTAADGGSGTGNGTGSSSSNSSGGNGNWSSGSGGSSGVNGSGINGNGMNGGGISGSGIGGSGNTGSGVNGGGISGSSGGSNSGGGGGGGGGPGSRDLEGGEGDAERVTCYPPLERQEDLGVPSKGGHQTRLRFRG